MVKIVTTNRKAYHEYDILEKLEVGIVLTGDEVKSLRSGQVSLVGSFATVHEQELYLLNCHITPYSKAYQKSNDEFATRRRKLLLHKRQLNRLIGDISKKGITAIPLSIYFNKRNIAKVELGLAKHKKAIGKKLALKERDIKRESDREMKNQ